MSEKKKRDYKSKELGLGFRYNEGKEAKGISWGIIPGYRTSISNKKIQLTLGKPAKKKK